MPTLALVRMMAMLLLCFLGRELICRVCVPEENVTKLCVSIVTCYFRKEFRLCLTVIAKAKAQLILWLSTALLSVQPTYHGS